MHVVFKKHVEFLIVAKVIKPLDKVKSLPVELEVLDTRTHNAITVNILSTTSGGTATLCSLFPMHVETIFIKFFIKHLYSKVLTHKSITGLHITDRLILLRSADDAEYCMLVQLEFLCIITGRQKAVGYMI